MFTTHVPLQNTIQMRIFSSFGWKERKESIQLFFGSQLFSKLRLSSLCLLSSIINLYFFSFLFLSVLGYYCSLSYVHFCCADKAQYFYLSHVTAVRIHRDYIYTLNFWWTCWALVYMQCTISCLFYRRVWCKR